MAARSGLAMTIPGRLVEHGDGVRGEEEVALAAGPGEAVGNVLHRVLRQRGPDGEAVVEPGVEGAVAAEQEAVPELEQADQDQG